MNRWAWYEMYNSYLNKIKLHVIEINDKLINDEIALVLIEDIYRFLGADVSYNNFIQICRYIFAKNGLVFDIIVNSKNENYLLFKRPKSGVDKTYKGESMCSLCTTIKFGSEHHIKPRKYGGTDANNNLVFLCIDCHNKIEMFCSCCENSKTICDKQMFNSCWRRNNAYFIQTDESKSIFEDIEEIPRFNFNFKKKRSRIRNRVNRCMICKSNSYFTLNKCMLKSDSIVKLGRSILKDKAEKNIIYVCDKCFDYAIMIENVYLNIRK